MLFQLEELNLEFKKQGGQKPIPVRFLKGQKECMSKSQRETSSEIEGKLYNALMQNILLLNQYILNIFMVMRVFNAPRGRICPLRLPALFLNISSCQSVLKYLPL